MKSARVDCGVPSVSLANSSQCQALPAALFTEARQPHVFCALLVFTTYFVEPGRAVTFGP